jgi:hypothetical protein
MELGSHLSPTIVCEAFLANAEEDGGRAECEEFRNNRLQEPERGCAGTLSERAAAAGDRDRRLGDIHGDRFGPPYPGYAIYLEPFFICSVKRVGETPSVGEINLQLAVDGNCGLAFAKVYPSENSMNVIDLLEDRVIPFYRIHGIDVERAVTPRTREYCAFSIANPFKLFLLRSNISHEVINTIHGSGFPLCETLHRMLLSEVFEPELRQHYDVSYAELQQKLDFRINEYNRKAPVAGPSSSKSSPLELFLKGISAKSQVETANQS